MVLIPKRVGEETRRGEIEVEAIYEACDFKRLGIERGNRDRNIKNVLYTAFQSPSWAG